MKISTRKEFILYRRTNVREMSTKIIRRYVGWEAKN
ncbi:hypothetical protein EV214_10492 [Marinisporobacter balticus]|uniref:Uncharacterized protein n=1 Tax=Marinisporobacter balticus TaxID=2018667 RepID=A0A4R2L0K0_9FIRM|nr:hypothetical protein EV214_10492 [Marinisporobacter balticus]